MDRPEFKTDGILPGRHKCCDPSCLRRCYCSKRQRALKAVVRGEVAMSLKDRAWCEKEAGVGSCEPAAIKLAESLAESGVWLMPEYIPDRKLADKVLDKWFDQTRERYL